MKALIIANKELKIKLVEAFIENKVSKISVVNTIEEAALLLFTEKFDYLFLDHQLPDGVGSDFLKQIKEEHSEITCVSISTDNSIIYDYKNLGYHHVFQYPFKETTEEIFNLTCN
jgi:two-component SAPR family response regulator